MDSTNSYMKPSENNYYKSLLNSMPEMASMIALSYHEKGTPIAFYTRDLNLPFFKPFHKTKQELLNKKRTSVTSVVEDKWLNYFASADKTGKAAAFKSYSKEKIAQYV